MNYKLKDVLLTIVTEEKGNAIEVDETSGLTEFQKEVCELARQAQFFPTLKDEEPVEQKINIRFSQPIL